MSVSKVLHRSYPGMNSVLDIVLTDVELHTGERICQELYLLLIRYEQILSCHHPRSEVYQLNTLAWKHPVQVSPFLFGVLLECKSFFQLTGGLFDAGLKNLHQRSNPEEPIGMAAIMLEENNCAVSFVSEATAVDLGGIGKGLFLREAANVLAGYNITSCFLSFGGSSILTRGKHPHGQGWPLALREGTYPEFTFYLNNHAASISESHPEGSRVHILHPARKLRTDEKRLSFVQAYCPVVAEAISTALVIASPGEASEIVSQSPVLKALVLDTRMPEKPEIIFRYEKENSEYPIISKINCP